MAEWLRRRPVKSFWKHIVVQFLLSSIKKKIEIFKQFIKFIDNFLRVLN